MTDEGREDELEHDAGEADGADQDEDLDEDEEELAEKPRSSAVLPPVRGAQRTPAAPAAPRGSLSASEEELPYIDDPVSKIWVGAIVAVFALILAYALLFGKGGALTPPTPSPTPSPSPAPTATASFTIAPSPTGTSTPPASGVTPAPSASPVPSGSPVPSVSATPTSCATPTPGPSPTPAGSPGC